MVDAQSRLFVIALAAVAAVAATVALWLPSIASGPSQAGADGALHPASAAIRKPLPEDGAAAAAPEHKRKRKAAVATAAAAGTGTASAPKPVALPVSSPWSLPPMIVLRARADRRDARALAGRVLRSPRLALSPEARRAVEAGGVESGALALLLRKPKTGAPLLVFSASGRNLRVQETTLWMTRRTVRTLAALPRAAAPAKLLLEPGPGETDLAGPPPVRAGDMKTLVPIYRAAAYAYGMDWRILAAINRIETNLGSNTNVSSAGAVGWMQFMPGTWRMYGTDANGDGVADPYDPEDAIFSAARYLNAAGIEHDVRKAVWAYNHANWYVNDVLRMAASIPDDLGS